LKLDDRSGAELTEHSTKGARKEGTPSLHASRSIQHGCAMPYRKCMPHHLSVHKLVTDVTLYGPSSWNECHLEESVSECAVSI